jgi:thioredoxin reductase (NADPH)
MFNQSDVTMKYENIATTVFTPLELGTIGYSEEAAIEKFGEKNIDIYLSEFLPLEWTILEKSDHMKSFAKLVVDKETKLVIGKLLCHCIVCLTNALI